ncbi:MAG: LamG domain-containing protein, partial [Nanoarchaeota archaeon]
GSPLDASTHSNHGIQQGNVTQFSLGKFGKSFSFDGLGDSVFVPDRPSLDINSSFSVSFWFKGNASITRGQPLVGKWNGTSNQIAWFADIAAPGGSCPSSSAINFYVSEDGGSSDRVYVRECGKTYQDNQWHLFTGVFKAGSSINLYVDGVSRGSVIGTTSTVNKVYTNNQSLQIGTGYQSFQYNGSIDDLLIFRRVLSRQEVLALYNANSNNYANTFSQVDGAVHTLRASAVNNMGVRNSTSLRTFRYL